MSKHTPGPWRIDDYDHTMIWGGADQSGREMRICDLRGWGHLTGAGARNLSDEDAAAIQDANARLIAAAPELLDACHVVLDFLHHLEDNTLLDEALSAIRRAVHAPLRGALETALAKAEGKPKEGQCDTCGGPLAYVAGPNVRAVLCPVCDADSSAFEGT